MPTTQAQRDAAAAKKRRQREAAAARALADAVLDGSAGVPSMQVRDNARQRDAAAIIKNRILDALETVPDPGEDGGYWDGEGEDRIYVPALVNILSKDLQPALATALKAQAIEDKREQKKTQMNFWLELGVALVGGPVPQLEAGDVFDGTAVEVE